MAKSRCCENHGSDSEVYELLAGYRDENGVVHRSSKCGK